MTVIETPQQAIEYLKICEVAEVTQPIRSYYEWLRVWLEKLIRA
ncbi:hypothetical protein SPSIL_057520 [Sporomusa silvacetica DSM 10669]|uniref:Uncharacterized protein n=1 Tax=Sporomusa silvacetica DSM 10669 TaxID=1123289 RepID=A0ABZ3IVH4_9FIRM|nr:hypothetical protein [Sporomusa silvacetica]OZC14300.1 hypothetical protein SPSIL_50270 [Sporomusa silvacetica DSM 10669]